MAEASSDVSPEKEERRAAIVISPNDVGDLAEQLHDIAGIWDLFVGLLKVPTTVQDQIKLQRDKHPRFAQICLVDGLQHWVVSDPSPTVEKVIAALSSRTINNKLLAAEIARKWGIQDDATPIIEATVASSAPAKATTLSNEDRTGSQKPAPLEHDNRSLKFKDLKFDKKPIGRGGCGTVYRGSWKHWDGHVAIKDIQEGDKKLFDKELKELSKLKHPNIIKLYGSCTNNLHCYIVTELAELGSLYDHIQNEANKGNPDMVWSLRWAADIAEAMCYLHDKNVVHRDLKSPNILLTSERIAKICDFGIVRVLDCSRTASHQAGTYRWMAPEVITQEHHDCSCDVFSFGMVLWELITHETPFEGKPDFQVQNAIVSGQVPVIPEHIDGYIKKLIENCWDMDRKKRPTFCAVRTSLKEIPFVENPAPELQSICTAASPLVITRPDSDACELSVKDIGKVLKELEQIIDWYSLGTYLEVEAHTLDAIERENITIKLRMIKMLQHWLRTGRGCSWRKLVEALYLMGQLAVADNIRRKHLSLTTPVPKFLQDHGSYTASPELSASIAQKNKHRIVSKFSSFLTRLRKRFEALKVDPVDLRAFLAAYGTSMSRKDFVSDVQHHDTLALIFNSIAQHGLWDHLNFDLAGTLVEHFTQKDQICLELLEGYQRDFTGYLLTTEIVHHIAAQSGAGPTATPRESIPSEELCSKLTVKLAIDITTHSLKYVEEVWRTLLRRSELPKHTWLLQEIAESDTMDQRSMKDRRST